MQRINWRKQVLRASGLAALLMLAQSGSAWGQTGGGETPESAQKSDGNVNPAEVLALLRQLQSQVRDLNAEVGALKEQQQSAQTESAALRKELDQIKSQLVALSAAPNAGAHDQIASSATVPQKANDERINKLEEYQQVADAKAAEQKQTKVESSSKYRVRLSGIVLFNTYVNRGTVENEDFPQLATAPGLLSPGGSFGASLRQPQMDLQGFGPPFAGERPSAQ